MSTDDAKDPQPEGQGLAPPTPRIALVDGEAQTALSAEALVVALFAGVKGVNHDEIIHLALKFQAELDKGLGLKLIQQRIVAPARVIP